MCMPRSCAAPAAPPRPCAVCSYGDECGGIQHCDGCDRPFHIDGLCSVAFLGKAFDTAAGDVLCLDCTEVEEGGEEPKS